MAVLTSVVTTGLAYGAGTQDITDSTAFGGETPKAVILFAAASATTANVWTGNRGGIIGMAALSGSANDGSCTIIWDADGVGSQAVSSKENLDTAQSNVALQSSTDEHNTSGWRGGFSGIANGIRIGWNPSYLTAVTGQGVTCIMFGGSDLSAVHGQTNLGNTADTEINITSIGFEPDMVFLKYCAGITQSDETSFGVAHNNRAGTITQGCVFTAGFDGQSTMRRIGYIDDSYIGFDSRGWNLVDYYIEAYNFDSSGFSLRTISAGGNNADVEWLAIRLGAGPVVDGAVWTYTTPTSTGNATDAGPNFKPQIVGYIGSNFDTVDVVEDDGTGAGLHLMAATTSDEGCLMLVAEDGASTSNTATKFSNNFIEIADHQQSGVAAATLTSMQSTGPQSNWSTAPGTALKFIGWAIEEEAAGGTTYDDSISDQQDLSDTQAAIATLVNAITDGVNAGETWAQNLTADGSTSDTQTLADLLTEALVVSLSTSDTQDLSDVFTQIKIASESTSDTQTLADLQVHIATLQNAIADIELLSDVFSATADALNSTSDVQDLSDVFANIATIDGSIADQLNLADAWADEIALLNDITDVQNLSDAFELAAILAGAISELQDLSDTYTNVVTALNSISDSMTVSDLFNATITVALANSDTQNLSDSWLDEVGAAIYQNAISDTLTVADALATLLVATNSIADQVDMSDTVAAILTALASTTDQVTLSDTFGRTLLVGDSISDTKSLSDAWADSVIERLFENTFSDQTNLSESFITTLTALASTGDTQNLSDAVTSIITADASFADVLDQSDSFAGEPLVPRSISDSIDLSDTVAPTLIGAGSLAETSSLSDSWLTILTGINVWTETINLSDLWTRPDAANVGLVLAAITIGAAVLASESVTSSIDADLSVDSGTAGSTTVN